MTSSDFIIILQNNNEALISEFRADLAENSNNLRQEFKAEIQQVNQNVLVNSVKIEELHFFFGIGIAIISIAVTLGAAIFSLAPMFREMFSNIHKPKLTEERVKELINEAMKSIKSA